MSKNVFFLSLCGLLSLVTAGCSTSTISTSWSDPALPAGQIEHIAVLGVAKNDAPRRSFEDKMVAALKGMGVNAEPTYPFISHETPPGEDAMRALLLERNYDSVMVVRVTDERTETMVTSGTVQGYGSPYGGYGGYGGFAGHGGWYGNYSRSYYATYTPPRVVNYEVLTIEAAIHAVAEDRLYWTAQAESMPSGNIDKTIQDLVTKLADNLKSGGVLR